MEDEDNLDNINIEEIDKDLYNEENSNLEQDNNILDKERLSENSKNEEQLKGRFTVVDKNFIEEPKDKKDDSVNLSKNNDSLNNSRNSKAYEEKKQKKEKKSEVKNKIISLKIILVGDVSVGKTSVLERYINNNFKDDYTCTIQAEQKTKIINEDSNTLVRMNIWDTAGQEKFHSLGKHFYKDAYVVCLVYDITSQESLDQLQSIWYPDLQKYGEKYTLLAVVGNKCDLYEGDKLADENAAKEFAQKIGATFIQTSAKTGEGINKLFDILIDRFLSPEFNPKYEEMMKTKGNTQVLKPNDTGNAKKKKGCC